MEHPDVQQLFFQHIRSNLPPQLSMVDEIAELLNISIDSAYRRIRGEKPISFDEIRALCVRFKISLDQLFQLDSETIIFSGKSADNKNFSFEMYLRHLLSLLENMNSFERKELLYLNKDIPIFHLFNFHDLAAFKFFFWMKTVLQYPQLGKVFFVKDEFNESLQETGKQILIMYNKVPSQEVWNVESIHSTIRQIEYYKETKVFASAQDIVNLYDCLQKTIDHIETQAEAGFKFSLTEQPVYNRASYKLYINEFILGDNTNLAILNDSKVAYINHSVLNIIWTKDREFTEYTYQHFQNIIRKSTLVSDVGERERNRFFNTMREKIENRQKAAHHYKG